MWKKREIPFNGILCSSESYLMATTENWVTVGAVFLIALVVLSTCFGFVLLMVSSVWSGLNSNLVLGSRSAQIHRSSYKWWAEVKQSDCLNICAGLTGKREKKRKREVWNLCHRLSVQWLSLAFNWVQLQTTLWSMITTFCGAKTRFGVYWWRAFCNQINSAWFSWSHWFLDIFS